MTVIPEGYGQVTYHFIGGAAPSGAYVTIGIDVTAFSGSIDTVAANMYQNLAPVVTGLSGSLALADCVVKYGPTSTGPSAMATGETVGGVAASSPPNAAILVQKLTNLGGRRGRGRMFFPGISEAVVDNAGQLTTAFRNSFQANMETFHDNCDADLINLVLLHNSAAVTPTDITGFNVEQTTATQRRRLRR